MSSKQTVTINKPQAKVFLKDNDEQKIAVCAYCRVSTDKDDQRNSFEAQKRFFDREFENHPNWTVRTIYADKGISGTSLKKRDEFNRMIADAMAGRYDLIITKEVSRFSRNVRDILNIVGDLRDRGVHIWFLAEDIYTEDKDYEEQLIKRVTRQRQKAERPLNEFNGDNSVKWKMVLFSAEKKCLVITSSETKTTSNTLRLFPKRQRLCNEFSQCMPMEWEHSKLPSNYNKRVLKPSDIKTGGVIPLFSVC